MSLFGIINTLKAVCTLIKSDKSYYFNFNQFVTGRRNVKKESVKFRHKQSVLHKLAVGAKLAADKKQRKEQSPIERGLQKMDEKTLQKMDKLFQTAFCIAWKERPFIDFPDLLDLQTLNGVGLWGTYHSDKAAKEFISHIAGVYQDDLQKHLHKSDYFSVYCDGSTDRSEGEKELVMGRVTEDFYPVVKYLRLVEPANTKADGTLAAINRAFAHFGFSAREYKQKMIGFSSDGASVMRARRGVIELLKVEGQADWILSVWCLAHRLELAVKDCFKGTFMDNVTELSLLFTTFTRVLQNETKKLQRLWRSWKSIFICLKKQTELGGWITSYDLQPS